MTNAPMHRRNRIPGMVDGRIVSGIADVTAKANCVYWLSADSITGKVNNDSITTWSALKGGNWTNASGTPVYKTNIINSLPAIYLANDTYFGFTAVNARTIMGVFSSSMDANYRFLMGASSGYQWHGDPNYWADPTGYASPYIANASVYKSGALQGTAGAVTRSASVFQWSFKLTGALSTDRFSQGNLGSRNLLGYVAEILVFTDIPPDVDFDTVTAYLCSKYAL